MKHTGRYDPATSDYDVDYYINEAVVATQKFIKELKDTVGEDDYKKIARVIVNEYLDTL